jgi:dihydropteroate synthase
MIMGVLNVTPDSFSDGGAHPDAPSAIRAGIAMAEEGADWIDVGGESTRPGAAAVPDAEELKRVLPVVLGLVREGLRVSIDTRKTSVAAVCLEMGAGMVNDVTALSAPSMAEVCAAYGCTVCLMHMQGEPSTMQAAPSYEDVVEEVRAYLLSRAAFAEAKGIARKRIWIDPGIGFGKTVEHNLSLLHHLGRLTKTRYPVLLGVSRKSFLGRITGADEPRDRIEGALATQVLGQAQGVKMIRTHDVRATRRAIAMASAILNADGKA